MKMQNYNSKFKIIILAAGFVLLLSFPVISQAAILYFEPAGGQYRQGDTFIVETRIDTEGECVNAIKADLKFSQALLEAVDFGRGNSILAIWLEQPKIDNSGGLVSFSGGIPGGYCGILPGDPGKSNLLGKIIFKAREVRGEQFSASVEFLDSSQVLLNDGFGTPAKLTVKRTILTILPEKMGESQNLWKQELEKDDTSPESFKIEIQKDPSVFEGKYFIVFSASDKQTGIDHYEIREIPPMWTIRTSPWKNGDSPYLLEDQTLKSIIKVKAMDKAGNERIAEYLPEKKPFPWRIIILIFIIGAGVIWKLKTQNKKSKIIS